MLERRKVTDAQMRQLKHDDIYDMYRPLQRQFHNDYPSREQMRASTFDMLLHTEVMSRYLVELTSEELLKANESVQPCEGDDLSLEEAQRRAHLAEDQAASQAAARIKKITEWSQLQQNFTNEEKQQVIGEHRARMARYRKRKDWEAWGEEDETDLDGARIISEIKNYKSEFFWNTAFSQ